MVEETIEIDRSQGDVRKKTMPAGGQSLWLNGGKYVSLDAEKKLTYLTFSFIGILCVDTH